MTIDRKGRVLLNGKVLSDGAIEQRLRRWTALKKSGKILSGQEVKDMFDDVTKRAELIQLFKDSKLSKDKGNGWVCSLRRA